MTQTEAISETTLRITRKLSAPRELVFKAWTEPEFLAKWWAAHPDFTTPIAEVDLRVGGKYRLGMQPPDKDQPMVVGGIYREIKPPEKLVYTWVWEPQLPETQIRSGSGPEGLVAPGETLVTVEFHDVDGQTEIVLTHRFFSDQGMRDKHGQGWNGCLDNLAILVEA